LRWPNVHVRRFTLSFVYKVYIGFLSRMRDWTNIFSQSILSIFSWAYKSIKLFQEIDTC
jgi:hypothetical protein